MTRCRSRLLLGLLTFLLAACSADHHAKGVITDFEAAIKRNDTPMYVRLADPNMRAIIERGLWDKEWMLTDLDAVMQHPLRVVRASQGVVYLGWVPGAGERRILTQVVVGEGRVISKSSALRETAGTNGTTNWQVSVMNHEWALGMAATAKERATMEAALARIDEQLLTAWYFEGSDDARHEIKRQLETR